MQRAPRRLAQRRCAVRVASLAVLVACGDGHRDRDPGAGQTGSPAVPVPPDRESPVPFRPPEPEPPADELPDVPRVPFPGPNPERAVVFGDWLYVAMPEQLFAFDTSAPLGTAAPRPLMPDARPQWIGIEGDTLSLIANVVADDPALVEGGPVTRLYQLDVSGEPGSPRVSLSSVDLPGRLERARLEPGRLVTLTGVAADTSQCTGEPTLGYPMGRHPNQMVVTELGLDAGSWVVTEQVTVEAQGFVETQEAFVLTRDLFREPDAPTRRHAELTVVELSNGALTPWPRLDVEGWPQRGGPMAIGAGKLAAVLVDDDFRQELAVFSPGATPPELGALSPATSGDASFGAQFDGPFALVPSRERNPTAEAGVIMSGTVEPGLVIDWQREGGPVVVAELPVDLLQLFSAGERWLGIGRARSVLFHLGPEGTIETDAEFGPPAGLADAVSWNEGSQTLWLSFSVSETGQDSAPERYATSILDLSAGTPVWRDGPRIRGQFFSGLVKTPARVFAQTRVHGNSLLEALDPAATRSRIIVFGEQPLTLALGPSGRAELRKDYEGRRRLDVEQDGVVTSIDLDTSVEQLRAVDGGVLAYSRYADSLSIVAGTPAALESEVPLPFTEPLSSNDFYNWLEVVTQGERIAFLEQRSVRCYRQSDCMALGIELEPGEVSGGFQQHRLWPLDRSASAFAAPLLLPAATTISASRLSTPEATSLVLSTPLEVSDEDQVLRARIELLRFPQPTPDRLARAQRITMPGDPMFVAADVAVSIEPAGPALDAPAAVLMHRLRLVENAAYIEQTLELPAGHAGHIWANERGYVLLVPDDPCADPNSTLIAVGLVGGELSVIGEVRMPGTHWELTRATDELALLTRGVYAFDQHALIDVSAGGLSLRGYESVPIGTPLDVLGDQVTFGGTAPRGR